MYQERIEKRKNRPLLAQAEWELRLKLSSERRRRTYLEFGRNAEDFYQMVIQAPDMIELTNETFISKKELKWLAGVIYGLSILLSKDTVQIQVHFLLKEVLLMLPIFKDARLRIQEMLLKEYVKGGD